MLEGFGLNDVFYTFDFGLKRSFFWYIALISIFSWVFFCFRLSYVYFIILCFLEFLIFYSYGDFSIWLGSFLAVAFLLMIFDYKYFFVPALWNFLLCMIGVAGLYFYRIDWHLLFIESLAMAGAFSVMQIFGRVVLKKEILGDGDIIFIFAWVMLFGFLESLFAMMFGGIVGIVFASIKNKKKVPLIPVIILGTFMEFLLGMQYV